MPTKMKSFRLPDISARDLHDLADFFDCPETKIIVDLLCYSICELSSYLEEAECNSNVPYIPDIIKALAAYRWGYTWTHDLRIATDKVLDNS